LTFHDLNLDPKLLDGIDAMGFNQPTPIQQQAIPIILEGRDIMGIAQTGTGKTAAFLLPILHKIISLKDHSNVNALVIVPTRELAIQIDQAVEAYSYFTGISSIAIYGGGDGKEFDRGKSALVKGVDIVIATPGRLLSHMNLGYVNLNKLKFLILDEADRMLDMGFQPDLLKIVGKLNPERQTLMFSATMPDSIFNFAKSLLKNPARINIALSKPAEGVTQGAYVVFDTQKIPLVKEILLKRTEQSIIIFSSTKQGVNDLYKALNRSIAQVGFISSDLEQEGREKVMLDFKNGKVSVLIATDVVSRGIDIAGINMVINFDVPGDAEDYVHRVGRTARADSKGEAITLIGPMDQFKFQKIEQLIGSEIEKFVVPEKFGEVPTYDPKKVSRGPSKGGRPNFRKPSGSRPKGPFKKN
jgi:ATP-dependent RNA helicase RhlE